MRTTIYLFLACVTGLAAGCRSAGSAMVEIPLLLVDGLFEGRRIDRAEAGYRRQGLSEKEARHRVQEDDFFRRAYE